MVNLAHSQLTSSLHLAKMNLFTRLVICAVVAIHISSATEEGDQQLNTKAAASPVLNKDNSSSINGDQEPNTKAAASPVLNIDNSNINNVNDKQDQNTTDHYTAAAPTSESTIDDNNGSKITIGQTSCKDSPDICKAINGSHCKEEICQCLNNYIQNHSGTGCLQLAKEEGDNCEISEQCKNLGNSECVESKCFVKQQSTSPSPKMNSAGLNTRVAGDNGNNSGSHASAVAATAFMAVLLSNSMIRLAMM